MLKLLRGERTLAETQRALFFVAGAIILLLLALFGAGTVLLSQQVATNHRTIAGIQQSRLEGCLRTYNVLTELIAASADGRRLTPAQQKEFAKFVHLVDPRQCHK